MKRLVATLLALAACTLSYGAELKPVSKQVLNNVVLQLGNDFYEVGDVTVVVFQGKLLLVVGGAPPVVTPPVVVPPVVTPPVITPPDPIIPPVTSVKSVIILMETGDLTADQAQLLNQLRSDPVAKSVKMLDKDAQTTDGQPLELVAKALKFVGDKPLPVILAIAQDGSFIAAEALPKNLSDALSLLKKWGLRS